MKNTLSTFIFIFFINYCFSQPVIDSGQNLTFLNPTTNRVNIPSNLSFINTNNDLTIEAWVNPSNYTADGGMIFSKLETIPNREYYIYIQSDGLLRFVVIDNLGNEYWTVSTISISLNTWTHVSATYSFVSGNSQIYINGISNRISQIGHITLASTKIRPLIGAYWLSNNNQSRSHFQGSIDEVRLWHEERTQTQIRDNMCQTLATPQLNLIAYYQLDETSGLAVNDASGNNNNGTMEFFPVAQINNRPFSGAPIGDVSINSYSNQPANWVGQTFTLNSTAAPTAPVDARSLRMDNITGTPDAIHIFRVNSRPSQTGGLSFPLRTYFGTFIVNQTTPATAYSYRAVYDYTPFNGHSCEPQFKLFSRTDNSIANWNDVGVLNTVNNVLRVTNNIDRQEFVLETCAALPVDMIAFDLKLIKSNEASISWSTKSEHNNYAFYIERSTDSEHFEVIAEIKGYKESESIKEYNYIDTIKETGEYYYRIKQVDLDAKYSYSEIKVIKITGSENISYISPNPGNGLFNVHLNGKTKIIIRDLHGRIVESNFYNNEGHNAPLSIDLSNLNPGIYFVDFTSGTSTNTEKLIIQ